MNNKLYRSRREKVIAGVCGGLAAYFNADPTLVRLIFIVLALLDGVGFLIYFLMMIIVPKEGARVFADEQGDSSPTGIPSASSASEFVKEARDVFAKDRSQWVGIALIAIGAFFFLNRFLPPIRIEYMLAAALIVLGLYITARKV